VLGTGIRRIYPAQNAALAERIVQRGAVVSQFWLDTPPTRFSFPMRNVVTNGMGLERWSSGLMAPVPLMTKRKRFTHPQTSFADLLVPSAGRFERRARDDIFTVTAT
jgi:hypothetical protein